MVSSADVLQRETRTCACNSEAQGAVQQHSTRIKRQLLRCIIEQKSCLCTVMRILQHSVCFTTELTNSVTLALLTESNEAHTVSAAYKSFFDKTPALFI